jgi:hypothetical protein
MTYRITHFYGENKIGKIIVCEPEKVKELFDFHCDWHKKDEGYDGSTCVELVIHNIDVSKLSPSECRVVINDLKRNYYKIKQ